MTTSWQINVSHNSNKMDFNTWSKHKMKVPYNKRIRMHNRLQSGKAIGIEPAEKIFVNTTMFFPFSCFILYSTWISQNLKSFFPNIPSFHKRSHLNWQNFHSRSKYTSTVIWSCSYTFLLIFFIFYSHVQAIIHKTPWSWHRNLEVGLNYV